MHQLATSFKYLVFFLTIAVEILCKFFKDEVQLFVNMTGFCKSSCGTVVRTGAVTRYDFPSDISLRSYDVNTKVE